MKKVIIALLVVASLFAFVSCKEAEEVIEPELTKAEKIEKAIDNLKPAYANAYLSSDAAGFRVCDFTTPLEKMEGVEDYYVLDLSKVKKVNSLTTTSVACGLGIDLSELVSAAGRSSLVSASATYAPGTDGLNETTDPLNPYFDLKVTSDQFNNTFGTLENMYLVFTVKLGNDIVREFYIIAKGSFPVDE